MSVSKIFRHLGVFLLVSSLVACGGEGGGGSAPADGNAGGETTPPPVGESSPSGWQLTAVIARDIEAPDLEGSSVDVNSSGQSITAWDTYDMMSEFYRSRVAVNLDGNWSVPMDVVSGAAAGSARVAINDAGEAVVVWEQWSTEPLGGRDLWARHYANGSWSDPQQLSPAMTGEDYYQTSALRLGKDGSGRFHVVWDGNQSNQLQPGVFYRSFANGEWTAEEKIAERPAYVNPHQLHVMANGDLYYLYTEQLADRIGVRLKKRIDDVWGEPVVLDADMPDNYDGPDNGTLAGVRLSVNAGGDILVAWSETYYDDTEAAYMTVIVSKAFNTGTGLWRAAHISDAARAQYGYVTALNDAGEGAVAWFREAANASGYEGNIRFVSYDIPAGSVSAEADVYATEQAPFTFKDFLLIARDNGDIWLANIRSGLNLFKLQSGSMTALGRLASASEVLSCAEQGNAVACAWGTYNLAYPWSTELAGAILMP